MQPLEPKTAVRLETPISHCGGTCFLFVAGRPALRIFPEGCCADYRSHPIINPPSSFLTGQLVSPHVESRRPQPVGVRPVLGFCQRGIIEN